MNIDPQNPIHAESPRHPATSDGQARPTGTEAPRFPSGALGDWLNHRLKLNVPVWAVMVASLVLLVVALD
jgi:hypothetical protein